MGTRACNALGEPVFRSFYRFRLMEEVHCVCTNLSRDRLCMRDVYRVEPVWPGVAQPEIGVAPSGLADPTDGRIHSLLVKAVG